MKEILENGTHAKNDKEETHESLSKIKNALHESAEANKRNGRKVAQEFRNVHDRFDAVEDAVADLKNGQVKLEADVAHLKNGQAKLEDAVADLKNGQAKLEAGQTKLEADVADLKNGQNKIMDVLQMIAKNTQKS